MPIERPHRRGLLAGLAALGGLALSGCDRLSGEPRVRSLLGAASTLTYRVQRLLLGRDRLAREYGEADISPEFRANGSTDPQDDEYLDLTDNEFAAWRLKVDGLVEHELALSLADLRALPSRTQITRHDCVEGWSCIGKWTGVPLAEILARAGVKGEARYVVFHCADTLERRQPRAGPRIDPLLREHRSRRRRPPADHPGLRHERQDARHRPWRAAAPALERQLGYKMAKYIMRIELVRSFAGLHGGSGGYWEDRGYEWYAGI